MKLEKHLRSIIISFLLFLLLLLIYFTYMNDKIFKESCEHLDEIYSQVNSAFSSMVIKNWNLLEGWRDHITAYEAEGKAIGDDSDFQDIITGAKERWGFTGFLFLDENGEYMTINRHTGNLDLGDDLDKLINDNQNIVTGGKVIADWNLTIFAIPAKGTAYDGFEYSAMAIIYNTSDMVDTLRIESFNGEAKCYVVASDGSYIFSMLDKEDFSHNIISYIVENAHLNEMQAETLKNNFRNNISGSMRINISGTHYYIVYKPVGFQNWLIVGVIPQSIVNLNINKIQIVTVAVMTVFFMVIISFIIYVLIRRKNYDIGEKEKEIKYREQLFDILVNNTDDIFIVFEKKISNPQLQMSRALSGVNMEDLPDKNFQKSNFAGGRAETGYDKALITDLESLLYYENYTVGYVSSNIERALGVTRERIMEDISNVSDIALDGKLKVSAKDFKNIKIGECLRLEREVRNCKTGDRMWYSEKIYHTAIEDTEKYVLVFSDRTKERESSEHIREALDIAKKANAAKSNFMSKMSHDIRTPMNAIVGLTELLGRNCNDAEKVEEYTSKIKDASNHLLNLINDVLDMSKIESGKTSLNEIKFSIEDMANEISELIKPQARAKSQLYRIKKQKLKHKIVYGDKLRISQIILNLLSNAVKYTGEHGRIIFTISESDESSNLGNYAEFCFEVEDNGIGIGQDYRKNIFEPFTRENDTLTNQIQGSGLGMAIAKNLVDLMGGTIEVESEVNVGSKFTVRIMLKVEENDTECEKHTVSDMENISLKGLNVLVAEDYKINADILAELLHMEGMSCDIAKNGEEAFEKFEQSKEYEYDIILMDIQMPVMNGYDAVEAIRALDRADAKSIPIAAMTANAFADDVKKALEVGMNEHVSKPIDVKVLCQKIADLINRKTE